MDGLIHAALEAEVFGYFLIISYLFAYSGDFNGISKKQFYYYR